MRFVIVAILCLLLSSCVKRADSLEPIVNITNPANGTVSSSDNLSIVGFAMDDEGIRAIRVGSTDILQTEQLKAERGKRLIQFSFRPALIKEGQWGAEIVVEDSSGRKKRLNYSLSIDATPPTVKVIKPSNENGMIRVVGAARDNQALGKIIVNGVEVAFSAGKEKFFTVDVESAETIQVIVVDEAGNQTERVISM